MHVTSPPRRFTSLSSLSPLFAALLAASAFACVAPEGDSNDEDGDALDVAPTLDDVSPTAAPPPPGNETTDPCLQPIFTLFPPKPGDVDTSFGCQGVGSYGTANADFTIRAIAVQPDDKIVVVGARYTSLLNNNDLWVSRFTASGALDTTFATGGVFTTDLTAPLGGGESANAVVIAADGGIIVGGNVHREDGELRRGVLIRLTPAGALDTTFGTGGMIMSSAMTSVNALRYQSSDNQIVAAGQHCTAAEVCTAAVGRFAASSGAPVASFSASGVRTTHLGGSSPSNAYGAALYGGRVVIAGQTKGATAGADLGAARFHATGLDTTFGSLGTRTFHDASYERVTAVATVPVGKFLLAGWATLPSGRDEFMLRRLNNSGTTDISFGSSGRVVAPFSGYGASAHGVVEVAASKAVAVGTAKTAGGKNRAAVARFTSTGSLDTTFSGDGQVMLTARNDEANATAVAVQSSGRIVVAGWSMNTSWRRRGFLVRLHQ